LVPVEESPVLLQPEWVSANAAETVLQSAAIGAKTTLSVNTQNLTPGDLIRFTVYRAADDAMIASATGNVGSTGNDDKARCRSWTIPVQTGGASLNGKEIYFIARFPPKDLEVKSPLLQIGKAPFKLWLEMDVDNPKAKDDTLILLDADGGEVKRTQVSELREDGNNRVCLVLEDLDRSAKYSMIRDLGSDEDGGKELLFEAMSPDELEAWFENPASPL
ncbi:MAG: hypothetical protein M3Y08_18585, partial [Fibrobacterota bacterium]|nr:hypothetical protein [Fibrobacterota bacterium]